jgi:DNA/RNA-binding domain of Phe-tRNA-synthetase-like protein
MLAASREVRVQIDPSLGGANASLALGCVQGRVVVQPSDSSLLGKLNQSASQIAAELPSDKIGAQPFLAATREAYRALGKDPSRYRGSSEALLRRVVSGKGLYFINNVVDINNLLSLKSFLPIGSYDLERISDPIIFRTGTAGESYKAIGKDVINLESLPVFSDAAGPFGSPTSDSERAMIAPSTRHLAMMIIDFSGKADLEQWCREAIDLLREHASGDTLSRSIIR